MWVTFYHYAIYISVALSVQNAEAVVLVAFSAHFFKDISRSQLESAAKLLLSPSQQQSLHKAEKIKYVVPLGEAFLAKKIVKVKKGVKLSKCARGDLEKVGTF